MMIKRRPNCGLVMVADKKAIETVVNLVRKAWEDGKESQRQNRLKREAEREELITDVDDEDKGRISWNFRFGSWQIHYYSSPGAPVKVAIRVSAWMSLISLGGSCRAKSTKTSVGFVTRKLNECGMLGTSLRRNVTLSESHMQTCTVQYSRSSTWFSGTVSFVVQ